MTNSASYDVLSCPKKVTHIGWSSPDSGMSTFHRQESRWARALRGEDVVLRLNELACLVEFDEAQA